MTREVSDDTKQTIGKTLKHLRQEKLWSQAELANRIGTTPVSVGRWENNITRPNLHFQQQLCTIFGKSPEDLGFVPHTAPELREDFASPIQQETGEQTTIPEQAPGTSSSPAPAPSTPLRRMLVPGHLVRQRSRRTVLVVMASCLSLFLLLSTLSWYARHYLVSSTSHAPSCQVPSSQESAAAIYAQVMCKHVLLSSSLDRQDGLRWDENDQCGFRQGAYHVLLPATAYVAECFAHVGPFGPNVALQVDMTVLKGYSGGLVFRAQGPSTNWDVIISRIPIDIWGQYNFDLASTNMPCHLSKDPIAPNYCYSPHGTIT